VKSIPPNNPCGADVSVKLEKALENILSTLVTDDELTVANRLAGIVTSTPLGTTSLNISQNAWYILVVLEESSFAKSNGRVMGPVVGVFLKQPENIPLNAVDREEGFAPSRQSSKFAGI
jgi:hypothetical protein